MDPAVLPKLALIPAHITCVGEKCNTSFNGKAIDTLVDDNSVGDGCPDQDEITKRRKVTGLSRENVETLPTMELTKIDGDGKSEKKNGTGQLIAFTRRKKKKEVARCLPDS